VGAWKEGEVGFEVGGRIDWIAEAGTIVRGRNAGVDGGIISEGEVIARLDPRRYELRVASTEAELRAAGSHQEAVGVEIEGVISEQLHEAGVQLERAERDFERIRGLTEKGVMSESEGDRAETEYETADAVHKQLLAKSRTKQAELKVAEARTAQAEAAVMQAMLDLENCNLIAPFDGQIAETFVNAGTQVGPGRAVVNLVVMNPLKVEVAVSAQTERKIRFGDSVVISVGGYPEPVPGVVHLKDTVADPATRTFKVTMMVQNRQILGIESKNLSEGTLPEFHRTWPILRFEVEGRELPFVETGTLNEDESGHFVWQVDEAALSRNWEIQSPVVTLRKRYVTAGARNYPLLGLMTFRELADVGDLTNDVLLASGVPAGVSDGDQALLARRRWLLRPGDLVDLSFHEEGPGEGFYLPMDAILKRGDRHYVYVIEKRSDDAPISHHVEIELERNIGDLWKVKSDGLRDGDRVIIGGAHYLAEGELVRPRPLKGPRR